jgi:putative pyoverdin transport system ATP-binding/permease protein
MPIPRIKRQSATDPGGRRPEQAVSLWQFVRQETNENYYGLFAIGSLSGISSALLLVIINIGAETADMGYVNFRFFMLFLIGMALFVYCKRHVMNECSRIFGKVTNTIYLRQVDKLSRANMQDLEKMGESVIYSRLTKELDNIWFFAPLVADAFQGAVMVAFSLFYLYYLSKVALLLLVGVTIFAGFFFLHKQKEITSYVAAATQKEVDLFEGLSHILDGFKEIKLNRSKNNALMNHIYGMAGDARDLNVRSGLASNFYFVFSQICFYALLGSIVFVLPHFVPTYPEVAIKTTMAILFMMGSLEQMVGVLPHYANIRVAIDNLYRLEDELDLIDERNRGIDLDSSADFTNFEEIRFEEMFFHYRDAADQQLFSIGPLDFSLRAGETVFVIGGNGSGKSTMIKILTGLYLPDSGAIRIDDRLVPLAHYAVYRDLFGGVLNDFHLFDRLYGVAAYYATGQQDRFRRWSFYQYRPVNGAARSFGLDRGFDGRQANLHPRRMGRTSRSRVSSILLRGHTRRPKEGWQNGRRRFSRRPLFSYPRSHFEDGIRAARGNGRYCVVTRDGFYCNY